MSRLSLVSLALMVVSTCASALPPALQPYLERHCLDCHDGDSAKGGLDLTTLPTDGADAAAHQRWVRAFDRVTSGEMPPAKQPRPKPAEQQAFLAALGEDLQAKHTAQKGTVLRRLNRQEYQNTISDLLGVTPNVIDLLPEDGRAQGFDTVGEALSISGIQMQRYLEAAELALNAALLNDARPESTKARYTLDSERNQVHLGKYWLKRDDGAIVVFNSGISPTTQIPGLRAPAAGTYKVSITGYGYQMTEPVVFALVVGVPERQGDAMLHSFHELPAGQSGTITVTLPLKQGDGIKISPRGLHGPSGRSPIKDGPDKYPGQGLALLDVVLEGPIVSVWPPLGQSRLLGGATVRQIPPTGRPPPRSRPGPPPVFRAETADPAAEARKSLPVFLESAFRRPVTAADIEPYVALFDAEFATTPDYLEAMRTAAIAALCSPEFLFLHEPAGRLNEYALATRLSYFLTRGPPDSELLQLAATGQLSDPATLRSQTDRLLISPAHDRFITDFTDGWLNLREIDFTTPDAQLYPEYDDLLLDSMLRETRAFIAEIISSNLGISNLVDSDFAMLNARLARHYGIAGVNGLAIRKVKLPPESKRGGLMTQASVLKVSANGTNTSPVVRGVWVMSRLLGTDLPPPPPGVTAVEPDIRGATTIRAQLEKHRTSTSCNSCHRIIDPPGFAMENYDVIGGWRHRFRSIERGDPVPLVIDGRKVRYRLGQPVDATGELPSGRKFNNMPEFQKLLLSDQSRVAHCVVEKLLTFATGREMGFSDRPIIAQLVTASKTNGYRVRDMIHAVVQSDIFLSK